MNKALRLYAAWSSLVVVACWASGGCNTVPSEGAANQPAIASLSMGTQYEAVVARLGPPERRESYRVSPDRNIVFLFYRTGPPELDSAGQDLGLTPLAMAEWGLKSTSRSYYRDISSRYYRIYLQEGG